jgi:hypothetical protein
VAPVQAERWKEVRKMMWRKLLVAVVLGLVVIGLVASGVWADTRGRQARPDYVEWGDPDSPAWCKDRGNPTAVTYLEGESGGKLVAPGVEPARTNRGKSQHVTVQAAHSGRCSFSVQSLGIWFRR